MTTRDFTNKVVILADHPSLHRGFSTVGRELASHLHARTEWTVEYVGYFRPDPQWRSPGYRVVDLEAADESPGRRGPRLAACLDALLQREAASPVLLSIGNLRAQRGVADALEQLSPTRRPRALAYIPIDYAPLPVELMQIARSFALLVPYSAFGRAALLDCARRAGSDAAVQVADPIAHGVDIACFKPLPVAERTSLRTRLFGLRDNDLLIGFFGRNSGHKRADLVLQLAQLLMHGNYVLCLECGRTNARLPRAAASAAPVRSTCRSCGSPHLQPGRARDDIKLYLHTDLGRESLRRHSQGRDLERIATQLGISSRVLFNPALRIGHGVPAEQLAQRMAACDLHLLPFDCAGWELTVLETGACGVANVITDYATPPQYAREFSRLVPPAAYLLGTDVRALMDVDLAVASLLELLDNGELRRRLASRGPQVAEAYAWPAVCGQWVDLLAVQFAAGPQAAMP